MQNLFDFRYDFVNGDWVVNVVNDVATINEENAIVQIIMLRLLIQKGKYILNPELGSDLHTLVNYKSTEITESIVQSMVEEALAPEIEGETIDNVNIKITRINDKIEIGVTADVIGGNTAKVNLLLGI
jgi:phage gp46-like protein